MAAHNFISLNLHTWQTIVHFSGLLLISMFVFAQCCLMAFHPRLPNTQCIFTTGSTPFPQSEACECTRPSSFQDHLFLTALSSTFTSASSIRSINRLSVTVSIVTYLSIEHLLRSTAFQQRCHYRLTPLQTNGNNARSFAKHREL